MSRQARRHELTERQRRFVALYLDETGACWSNATKAAAAAGYQGNYQTLRQAGSKTLRRPAVEVAINAAHPVAGWIFRDGGWSGQRQKRRQRGHNC